MREVSEHMEMPTFESDSIDELIRAGAIRLEITNGIPTWEATLHPPAFTGQWIFNRADMQRGDEHGCRIVVIAGRECES